MRVAMVSGAGRGLGRAIAECLLAEGWTVSAGLRAPAQASFLPADRCLAARFDAADPASAEAWVAATADRFGRIDALVNNAGILRVVDFAQGGEADLDAMWEVNAKAPFRLIRAALPHLRRTGAGRIVNIASTDAKRYRAGVSVGYTMTKHALLALTQAARFAGWEDGVRATAICTGAIDTGMIDGLPGVTPKADRLRPETVAAMVAFVLSLPNQASVPEFIANTRLESLI
ncbi:MAG: SDR family NAD(P)-dependent oxidoreductase [Rhodobacteraceae bacterium]|jgi:NAD(P)-dependent dehydrogenase (short-subunit alcohol dehydrogenase family)|nr:SDR family NAD(P)-dependent oxidoreductase [Paracoccaceae bacterium]